MILFSEKNYFNCYIAYYFAYYFDRNSNVYLIEEMYLHGVRRFGEFLFGEKPIRRKPFWRKAFRRKY
jgi:hypothetical protein